MYHLYLSVFITNKTPSGMIKHRKDTEPESHQKIKVGFLLPLLLRWASSKSPESIMTVFEQNSLH